MKTIFLFLLLVLCVPSLATAKTPPTTQEIRQAFHQIIDRPVVDLNPQIRPMPDLGNLSQEHLVFTSEPGQPVPALIIRTKSATVTRRPVVIILHGTGGYKEQNIELMKKLAARGFVTVSPDGRYHGERCTAGKGTADYYAAIAKAYEDGKSHPWLYDMVYDVTRLMDYLQTRPDIDPARIGLIGFSKGGMETYLTAAIDTRVAVAIPCISVQSFAYELEHDAWHKRISTVQGAFDAAAKMEGITKPDPAFVQKFYDRLVPGIDTTFDCPSMLPMICPRPLLTINGEIDGINPLAGAKLAISAATKAYAAAGVPEKFVAEIEPHTAHNVTPKYSEEAVEWFVRWLSPVASTTDH